MSLLRLHSPHPASHLLFSCRPPLSAGRTSPPSLPSIPLYGPTLQPLLRLRTNPRLHPHIPLLCSHRARVSIVGGERAAYAEEGGREDCLDGAGDVDLGPEGEVFRKTLRLVECAMLASVAGLTYVLSNSLGIENYFSYFFSLPIVISSMRWGLAAGRKTMVATALLLLTLSGPVKAATYLLMHGFLGLTMGSLWRLRVNWVVSVLLCTFVRTLGSLGYVLISSFLIRENILKLITINIHASLMSTFAAVGLNVFLSMDTVYTMFGSILMVNCGSFVFLLHILYAIFLAKLGMGDSSTLPRWLQKAV